MAAYFRLTRKGDTQASVFPAIDAAMREHFNVPDDPTKYFRDWYGSIGFALAVGRSWEDIRAELTDSTMPHHKALLPVLDWLQTHYTVEAWRGR